MTPTFATFFTTPAYRADAERLGQCCDHFGLPFRMLQGEEYGSWRRNCNQKPRLLQALRSDVRGPLVWLDSDCIIHQRPDLLLEPHADDALLWNGGVSDKPYINSQVMWWNDTAVARSMIDDWARRSLETPDSLADPLLKAAFDAHQGRAHIGVLPHEYIKPYWKPIDGVTPERIIISGNERRSVHADATPRQDRPRLEPLRVPYAR